jgi:TPP-dependent pyruvate/acetoin dehydrogenase alpha subunit
MGYRAKELDEATILNAMATLAALVDVLVEKGVVTEEEIEDKLAQYAEEAEKSQEEEEELPEEEEEE